MRMPRWRLRVAAVVAIVLGIASSEVAWAADQDSPASGLDAAQTHAIETIIHDYILNHPEVIVESLQKMRAERQKADQERRRAAAAAVRPVDSKDHIRGDPDAPVKIIEFSDFECPYCKRFHQTMKQVMKEYGKDGKVAWVYRHFPLDSLHSKARKEAQAAECANELGGNAAFWAYADKIFEVTPSNNRLDLAKLPQLADEIGLDRGAFEKCLAGDARGGKYAALIEADRKDAVRSGGTGTPYIIVKGPGGKTYPITGAQPYGTVKSIIETALGEK